MAVLWNTADKSANVTLSGGSLIATMSSAAQGAVRADTSFASGKKYYEALCLTVVGSTYSVGWANSSVVLGTQTALNKDSFTLYPDTRLLFNNTTLATIRGAGVSLITVRIAFDITNKLTWFAVGGDYWNGSSTADPGTGVGGASLSTINAGPYFPIFSANGSGASVIALFGATDFNYPVPSGFSGLDTNAQAFVASSKFLGYDLLGPPQNAAVSSKFLGYDLLGPPQNAVVASKLLGYAILQPIPGNFRRIVQDNPPGVRRVKQDEPVTGINPNLFPPVANVPTFNPPDSAPLLRRRVNLDPASYNVPLADLSATPIFNPPERPPLLRRVRNVDAAPYNLALRSLSDDDNMVVNIIQ